MDNFSFTQKSSYYVEYARFQKLGTEWNANDRNARHNPTGYHVLYYRTDSNPTKAAFHISPKQYILGKRLFESQLLLAGTDLSVREIAQRVGFENENYFSELFSAKVGISALKFRENAMK